MPPSLPLEASAPEEEELMPSIHRVIQYSGLTYTEVLNLPCDVFLLMVRNSVVDELLATEEGREYLKKCERLKKTETDLSALREFKSMRGGI